MSDTALQSITPLQALQNAKTELEVGLRFMSMGDKVDAIDREHIEKGLAIVRLLIESQK